MPNQPIAVDPAALDSLGSQLRQMGARIHQATTPLNQMMSAGETAAKNPQIATAVFEFRSRWGQSLGNLGDHVQTLGEALPQAAGGYAKSDGDTAARLAGSA